MWIAAFFILGDREFIRLVKEILRGLAPLIQNFGAWLQRVAGGNIVIPVAQPAAPGPETILYVPATCQADIGNNILQSIHISSA
jgi:hypothetical protein